AGLDVGDIIRTIDGTQVTTVAAAITALERAATQPTIVIEAERAGRAFTLNLTLQDTRTDDPAVAALITQIRKLDDARYVIPSALVTAVLAEPAIVEGG